jgi:uncharacterized membrane protein YagU involved in acid resistance
MSIALRALRGARAGLTATTTMSAVMGLAEKTHLLGEPPPKKITRAAMRRVAPAIAHDEPALDVASWLGHYGFGVSMGALYAVAHGSRRPSLVSGLLFGSAVWAVSYMGWVPAMGIMSPPRSDRPGRPEAMLLAHLVYGATLARSLR